MEAAAGELNVPEADKAAFAELYDMMSLKAGGQPPWPRLQGWQRLLEGRRAEVTVMAFVREREAEIESFIAANNVPRTAFDQRMVFTGIYGEWDGVSLRLEDALSRVKQDILAVAENKAPKCELQFKLGQFTDLHRTIRMGAFPYRPASCTSHGDETLDCWTPDGTLVGYIGFNCGGYIDDLAVLPGWQGRGVARGLVCGAARVLAEREVERIHLHVRACNYPAIGLYKSLGFSMGENEFPGWYDWHGGYKMEGKTKEVVAKMR